MSYFHPAGEARSKIEVKGSRFLAQIYPAQSRKEAEDRIAAVKSEFRDATHNCWAFRIYLAEGGFDFRSSDEGEPSGSAGRPILKSLEERNVADAVIIVTRYFGGTKLGMGGLSRAYRQAARGVIAECALREKLEMKRYEIHFRYCYEPMMRNHLYRSGGEMEFSYYEAFVIWRIAVPKETSQNFLRLASDICRGEIEIKLMGESQTER